VDYIFGHNPLGISFLTGFGDKTPMFIHHRQSAADGIAEPVPGLLSGGPNPKQQDTQYTTYPSMVRPMQSWVDQEPSYASNEICLNWNAPLVYVLGWLEANQ
jgi:endoglucanase